MRGRRTTCASIVLWAAMATTLAAQPTVLAGVGAEASIGAEWSDLPVYSGSPSCGVFERGSSFRIAAGGRVSLPLLFGSGTGLEARVDGAYASALLRTDPVTPTRVDPGDGGEPVTLDREFRLALAYWSLGIDALARHRFGALSLAAGPSMTVRLGATISQTDNILGPGDFRFPDGQSSHAMVSGRALAPASLGFGPMLSIGWDVPLGATRQVMLEITGRYDLLAPVSDAAWRSLRVGAGGALLWDVSSPASPPPIVPVVDVPTPRPRLAASIDIYATDSIGARVEVPVILVREVRVRHHLPILPRIFFEPGAATPAPRYALLAPDATDAYSVAALATRSVLAMQRNTLNIVGARMRADTSARVALYGSTSAEEDARIGARRALAVERYLESVWGIEPSRVTIGAGAAPAQRSNEATEDGRAENRRVELVSSSATLLAPVVTEELEQTFNPPLLRLEPTLDAEAGVRSWRIVVRQGGAEIVRYGDGDREAGRDPEIVWDMVPDTMTTAPAPVEAELTVEDVTGASVVARATVPLAFERRTEIVDRRVERRGDRERIVATLVGFDFESAALTREHRAELAAIASMLRPGAEIAITGYADRIGDERGNMALSSERAGSTAAIVRAALASRGIASVRVTARGAGVDAARFGNDLPEGRMLSRGVEIVIEQSLAE
jgi:outer membrane protein OmpA-like peptidoglycan-associated protein